MRELSSFLPTMKGLRTLMKKKEGRKKRDEKNMYKWLETRKFVSYWSNCRHFTQQINYRNLLRHHHDQVFKNSDQKEKKSICMCG